MEQNTGVPPEAHDEIAEVAEIAEVVEDQGFDPFKALKGAAARWRAKRIDLGETIQSLDFDHDRRPPAPKQ